MRYLRWLLLLLIPLPLWANTSVISGTFKDASGNPLNGTVYLQLPVPAVDTTTNTNVGVNPIAYRVVNGVVQGGPAVFDVATLQPQNLYYQATFYDNAGTKLFIANYPITGASYNLSAAIPTNVTTFNISYVSPAVTNAPNVFCCTQTFQGQIVSTITTGTAPFSITSTTLVPNLNVQGWGNVFVSGTPSAGQIPTATSSTAATWQNPSSVLALSTYTNNAVATVTNLLVKLTGNPSTVTVSGLTDTGGAIGICSSGCGNTGTAQITTVGQAPCTFDGATTSNDYVTISNSVQGDCHDAGAIYPPGQVIGRVQSTNGGGGTYNMTLFPTEVKGNTAIQASSITTLGGDVAVTATTITTVATKAVTMPSQGCPCRARVSWEAGATTSNSGGVEYWVNDGTNNFATGGSNTTGSVGPPTQFHASGSSDSTGTYANGAVITFTWKVESEQNITVRQSSQFSPQGSYLNVTIYTSN